MASNEVVHNSFWFMLIYIWRKRTHNEKKRETSVVVIKETGLEVNADKTNYMAMPRHQNAGRIHNMKIDNISLERIEQFKCLGTTLTNYNSVEEEIKSRLKSGNACYHLVQNLTSSSLLSRNIKIKKYKL
jgi:hypothetical protein